MSTVSYISRDAGACLKCHISYIATYTYTIAMPASVPTRVRSAVPFACFRAVCRVSCMDFAAGDGPLGTLRKPLRRLEVIADGSTGAPAVVILASRTVREQDGSQESRTSALTAGSTCLVDLLADRFRRCLGEPAVGRELERLLELLERLRRSRPHVRR